MPEAAGEGRPIGPDAKRFRAAFGVGADDGRIHPADAVGVPLAAIQGLREVLEHQQQAIDDLGRRVELAESRHRRRRT